MTAVTTSTELGWQLSLAPAVRMTLHGFQAEFGGLPATVWRVPGTVTLLASGPLRLTVAAPWSAVAAAGPGPDGIIEMVLMERPGEHERVPAAAAAAGYGPVWAGRFARSFRKESLRRFRRTNSRRVSSRQFRLRLALAPAWWRPR